LTASKDHYATLDLSRHASAEQVRSRFRELVRERHPDRFQGAARERAEIEFQAITEAFNVLSSPERRRLHDVELSRPAASSASSDAARLARFHVEAGTGFLRDGNYYGAAESFEQVTRVEPKNHNAWYQMAQALSHQKAYRERAMEAAVRAVELSPMNPDYLKLAGRLHQEAGFLDKAERYYNGARTWGGDDPVVEKALEELQGRVKKAKPGLFGKGT
jgi:tetratricopeptide (TPR) repeat protein